MLLVTWDGWWGNGHGGLRGLGWASNVGEGWGLLNGLSGDDVLMSSKDLLGSNLNGARANDSVVNNSLSDSWAGVKSLVDCGQRGGDVSVGRGDDAMRSAMAQADKSGENLRRTCSFL